MQAEPSNAAGEQCPSRVVRCERVLRRRTKSVRLVLDRITDPHNEAAAHRCAEALGVQSVWTVAPPLQPTKKRPKRDTKSVAKGADGWLSLRRFDDVSSCVAALRAERWDIWCTADGDGAVALVDTETGCNEPKPPCCAHSSEVSRAARPRLRPLLSYCRNRSGQGCRQSLR